MRYQDLFWYLILTILNAILKYYIIISKAHKLNKGVWGMPRLSKTMKDVISCDKLRLVAHTLTRRFPNGATHYTEGIVSFRGGKPGELKHLSTRRRRKQ